MAENRESVILQVGLDAGKVSSQLDEISRKIANVKKEQKQLDDEYKRGEVSLADYTASTAAMKDELSWLQKQQKGVIATTKLLTAENNTYGDSLNDERQKLADMQKAYDQLDADMRKGEGGQKFLEAIKAQSDLVKGLEEDTGRFQRNVGNYGSAFEGAADKAKLLNDSFKATAAGSTALGKGVDSVDKTMKVLTKNPLMGLVVAFAPLLSRIVSLVTQNKTVMEAVNRVMKPLSDALGWIADVIGNVLVGALNALESAWNAVSDFFSDVASWFGGGSSAVKENTAAEKEAARVAAEYAAQVDNLSKQLDKEQKALTQLQRDNKHHIDMLKARGAAEEDIRKAQFIGMAKELEAQREIYQDLVAEAEVYWEQMKAIHGENADGTINMYESQAKKYREIIAKQEEAYLQLQEMRRAGMVALAQFETDTQNKQTEKAKEARKKRYEEERAAYVQHLTDLELLVEAEFATLAAKEAELRSKAQEMLASLDESEEEEEIIPTPDEMARDMFGLDAEGVEYFKSLLDEGVSFSEAKTRAIADQTSRMTKSWATSFGALGDTFGDMANMLGEFSKDSAAAAATQKGFALMGILLNQAQSIANGALAISEGVASAASIPYPANIPAILSIVAQIGALMAGVGSTIVQSKQIFAQAESAGDAGKFEHGGTIEGTSYTGDKLIAHVNSGEGIYTGTQANNILQEIANNPMRGGWNYEQMADAMAAAIAAQPAPVMVYQEYKDFEQNVSTFNEIAKI